jgi:predicted Fe-Mo cluster-binding NifX family protein
MADKRTIAIAANDKMGLQGEVSHHFGRCPAYVLAEVEGDRITGHKVAENPHFNSHQPGQMPNFIKNLGADVILAGGMGPMAINMFNSMGIEVATGAVGKVENVLGAYLKGEVKGIFPCSHNHDDSCSH